MNVVIIEDEQKAAADLSKQLKKLNPAVQILAILDSIGQSVKWIQTQPPPDLIFMDIHLGDGNSLSIFNHVEIKCPVIFCTAYDEYVMDAFNLNGIAYLVKPFNLDMLDKALAKYKALEDHFIYPARSLPALALALNGRSPNYKSTYLVNSKTKIIPVAVSEIVLFYVRDGKAYLVTRTDEYFLPGNMESIENDLDPCWFYRANRQYIVSYRYIKEIEHFDARKIEIILKVPFREAILVSKEKATEFKKWMEQYRS